MEDSLVQTSLGKGPRGDFVPREGEALVENEKMGEYPFRRELEELVSSPMGQLKEGEMMEEGEIVVNHPLPSTPLK